MKTKNPPASMGMTAGGAYSADADKVLRQVKGEQKKMPAKKQEAPKKSYRQQLDEMSEDELAALMRKKRLM